jgi:hypothetical protein
MCASNLLSVISHFEHPSYGRVGYKLCSILDEHYGSRLKHSKRLEARGRSLNGQAAFNAQNELARFGAGFDNPGMTAVLPKPRRWYRFSTRTLLILVAVFCFWLTLFSTIARVGTDASDRPKALTNENP